jgi:hypothetical protein
MGFEPKFRKVRSYKVDDKKTVSYSKERKERLDQIPDINEITRQFWDYTLEKFEKEKDKSKAC